MKSLTFREIDSVLEYSQSVVGGQLRGLRAGENVLILDIFKGRTYSIVLDLRPQSPCFLILEGGAPIKFKKGSPPLALFLKSNFSGLKIQAIYRRSEYGRVIVIEFAADVPIFLEFRFFPHGQNLIAAKGGKKISWNKVRGLQVMDGESEGGELRSDQRSYQEIIDQWVNSWKVGKGKAKVDLEKEREKLKKKAEKLLKKLQAERETIAEKAVSARQRAIDIAESGIVKEIQSAFDKAKRLEKKLPGLDLRIQEVQGQVEKDEFEVPSKEVSKSTGVSAKQEELVKGAKRFPLESGALAVVGKNAKENIDLLRKAKAWDYWFHLKDFPGAYGFILRNKKQQIAKSEIDKVAQWVAKMSFKNKYEKLKGDKIEVLFCECRYLKPIKGDKLGRVTYKNAKTLIIKLE